MSQRYGKKTLSQTLRQYALVKVNPASVQLLSESGAAKSPLLEESVFVYLGEIPNMPGHCVLAGHNTGRVLSGFHIDHFVELSESET